MADPHRRAGGDETFRRGDGADAYGRRERVDASGGKVRRIIAFGRPVRDTHENAGWSFVFPGASLNEN